MATVPVHTPVPTEEKIPQPSLTNMATNVTVQSMETGDTNDDENHAGRTEMHPAHHVPHHSEPSANTGYEDAIEHEGGDMGSVVTNGDDVNNTVADKQCDESTGQINPMIGQAGHSQEPQHQQRQQHDACDVGAATQTTGNES